MFSTAAFRRHIAIVQPGYMPPVASTVRKYLEVQYLAEKTKLQPKLEEQDAVDLTCDFWPSNKNQSYITTTTHYIDTSWTLRSTVLTTRSRPTHRVIYQ